MFVGNGPAAAVKAPVVKAPAATQAAIAALRRILILGPFLLAAPGAPFGRPGDRTNNLRTGGPVPVAQARRSPGRPLMTTCAFKALNNSRTPSRGESQQGPRARLASRRRD